MASQGSYWRIHLSYQHTTPIDVGITVSNRVLLQTYKFPSLKENLSADVVVIGAGMYGLSIAYCLSKEGMFCHSRAVLTPSALI